MQREKWERGNMAHPRTSFRNIITRGLALMVMLCIYGFGLIGTSAVLLGAFTARASTWRRSRWWFRRR